MKLPLAEYGLNARIQPVFDHTFSGTYLECERMAYYQSILGRKARELDYSLFWGGIFHRLTELWELHHDLNEVIEVISMNVEEETDDRYGRNQRLMQDMFVEWMKYRKNDPLEVLRAEQPAVVTCIGPCIYQPNSPLGCNLTYGGKLDEIVRWNSLVGPLDFKTTVMTETDPVSQYKPSHQMMGYVWLASHLMGRHCWGAIVERIVANKSGVKIDRFPVPYSKDLIIEWSENERLLHAEILEKFQLHMDDEEYWKQNQSRCWLPYKCRYRDVCLSPREANFRLRWLRDNTIEERFDFQKREDKDAVPNPTPA